MPFDFYRFPNSSSVRGYVWDLDRIDNYAIPNFQGWKRELATRDISEAPNNPQLWEHQFPIGDFINGDMLTLDVSDHDGPQPVRYFSHELEGLHATALAPDLFTFIDVLSRLGWPGSEQDSLSLFLEPGNDRKRYLSATTAGAKAWLAWIERGELDDGGDGPPTAVLATTAPEHALIEAAANNSIDGVRAALMAGARPDVIAGFDWRQAHPDADLEFATAVSYATLNDNIAMLELLVAHGATLDTRRLCVAEAAENSTLQTLQWLIAHKARVNGWKHDRYWPIHRLVANRGWVTPEDERKQRAELQADGITGARAERLVPKALDSPSYIAMLNTLLDAGADPDAPWDNGLTMLMYGGMDTAGPLLAHGAAVDKRNDEGSTALFMARPAAKVRLLLAHGANVNLLSAPRPGDSRALAQTPLQVHILLRRWSDKAIVPTLLAAGADPKIRDGGGRSTLAYCGTVEDLDLIAAYGLDPLERLPDGGTLIHNLAHTSARGVQENGPLLDHLLSLGIDINAKDHNGRTLLHLVAAQELTQPADIEALLAKRADKSIKDNQGRRPYDLAPASKIAVRALLR